MRPIWLAVFTLLLWSPQLLAASFADRLTQLTADQQQLTQLTQMAEQQQGAEDWFLVSHAALKIRQKDAALQAVDRALSLGLSADLQVEALAHKALIYGMLFRDTPTALEFLKQAEAALNQLQHPRKAIIQTALYESFAQAYNQLGDITQAQQYADNSLNIALEHQLDAAQLQARLIAGRLELQQNNFAMAQLHFSQALLLAQQLHQTGSIGAIQLRLGMAYQKLGQFTTALEHLQQAEHALQSTERSNQLLSVLLNQAQVLLEIDDKVQAAAVLTRATTLSNKIQDPNLQAQLYYGQAELALASQQWADAEQLLIKSHQLYAQIRSATLQTETGLAIVQLALEQQQLSKAIAYLPSADGIDDLPLFLQHNYYEKSAQIKAQQQQWQQAYQLAEMAAVRRYKLVQQAEKQRFDGIQRLLQLGEQQQQLSTLRQSLQQQSQYNWALGATCLGLLVLLLYLQWRYKKQTPHHYSQPIAKNWLEFSHKVHKVSLKSPTLVLQAMQPIQSQLLLQQYGESALTQILQQQLQQWQHPAIIAAVIDHDVIWLVWRSATDLQQQAAIFDKAQTMQHSWFSCQMPLQNLLGQHWKSIDLYGLRELFWFCAQQQLHAVAGSSNHDLQVTVSSVQPQACSWQAENLRSDIQNAAQLGLLQFTQADQSTDSR